MTTIEKSLVAAALTAVLLVAGGCAKTASPGTGASSASEPGAGAAAATPPTIEVVAPTEGGVVPAGTITVSVETTDLEYTMPSNTNVAGQGHVHFTLDDRPFVMSTEPSAEIEDVEPGPHTLKAEVVQNNTQSLNPPVEAVVEFTAE